MQCNVIVGYSVMSLYMCRHCTRAVIVQCNVQISDIIKYHNFTMWRMYTVWLLCLVYSVIPVHSVQCDCWAQCTVWQLCTMYSVNPVHSVTAVHTVQCDVVAQYVVIVHYEISVQCSVTSVQNMMAVNGVNQSTLWCLGLMSVPRTIVYVCDRSPESDITVHVWWCIAWRPYEYGMLLYSTTNIHM